ncbi:MAG: DEAD/DEAH box helicase [Aestuariivirgaceae bacterium]
MTVHDLFHPAVASWFEDRFGAPTAAQSEAWPAIRSGSNALIAAPTGSGKTLAAFLAALDSLVRQGLAGTLKDETQIVYVSPLKALSNDIHRNLVEPLEGIRQVLARMGLADVEIRASVRTGDTSPSERGKMVRRPPHIVVTTPESLYILLGSESGRAMLATTRTIIVDEIHAVAASKRGSHLAISLERLSALTAARPLRIGLSATQKPVETVAQFLVGAGDGRTPPSCQIVDIGHHRTRDLAIEVPGGPLEAVMSGEVWEQIYSRLAALIEMHRTTLIFVNTRRLAERVTRQLSERLGAEHVTAHHGSMAKEQRLDAEQRLKAGRLKALVATASLELGIDIGEIELVCQIGSPHTIAAFLQRVGRSGHAVGGTPKGRLFPLSRDDLVECAALLDCVSRGELDRLIVIEQPLDVLAQQIAAEVGAQEWRSDDLLAIMRRAYPFWNLKAEDYAAVVSMLATGFTTRRGRRGALVHHDAVNGLLRGRRGTRLTALTAGGTIPDNADYQVLLEPEDLVVGTLNEDFAVESMAGDVFQLGNRSYRILRVERGTVRVEDGHGLAPTLPFWLGEAPGRSDELSAGVSRLRSFIAAAIRRDRGAGAARDRLLEIGIGDPAADQLIEYLAAGQAALGTVPTQETIVLERFFDEAGGMQLVIHSPYGSRINRAWGLALRKRFCRKFNFELQAAATEDNIVISLTKAHSFDLTDVVRYLHSASVEPVLVQALLDAPMFQTRWRWVTGVALALPRFQGGRKVAPQLVRMGAEDLMGAVFPDQIACAENLTGEREVPDHPLVQQTITDCLTEALDLAGLIGLLKRLESGEIEVVARDLTGPSPLAMEVLSARPYAFLDDAPLEERRTQAVLSRRWLSSEDASELASLDAEAIVRVRAEAWPEAVNADELHDALLWLGFLTREELADNAAWVSYMADLTAQGRAVAIDLPGAEIWAATERLADFKAVWPEAVSSRLQAEPTLSREAALAELLRGRLEGLGPVTEARLAEALGLSPDDIAAALTALQVEGFAMRGRYTPMTNEVEWCERRLLARIHNYTTKRLRAEIEPVAAKDFIRFLLDWQHVSARSRMEGIEALEPVVRQLEGFEAPAGAWEAEILPARLQGYDPVWLDQRSASGQLAWARLRPLNGSRGETASVAAGPVRTTPITVMARRHLPYWTELVSATSEVEASLRGQKVLDAIRRNGASFFEELLEQSGILRAEVEEALGELVSLGLVTSDSFAGLRALIMPASRSGARKGRRARPASGMVEAGRWALARRGAAEGRAQPKPETIEHVARALLARYGVVFWRLVEREAAWLPPWRELLRVYRRLESHGEIRGGRFVAGFSGEQFALPEAVGLLRELRREPGTGEFISVCAADPLNLVGVLTPGQRLPALTGNRLLYRDGVPVAIFAAGEASFLQEFDAAEEWAARKALLRSGPETAKPHFPRRTTIATLR